MKKIMKNRKSGFTLIEMLATILVLLIILLISTPSIRKMLSKSNELSKGYVEQLVIDSAKEYSSLINKEITNSLKEVGNKKIITLETLKNMGLIEEEDIIKLGPTARVRLTLKENSFIEFEIIYDDNENETLQPYIVLLGNNPHFLKQGKDFKEPGYIAFDKDGKIVTSKVVVSGTVNKDVVGDYILSYNLTDDKGNVAEPKTRTVTVVDSVVPAVTVAIATSNNIYSNKFVKNAEIVTVNITFSKNVSDPVVTIGGRTATVTGVGDTRVATYLIPALEKDLVSKALNINISKYQDEHENKGVTKDNVTSGGLVVYDNIKPVILSSSIQSNNSNNKLAKNGNTVSIITNFSEPTINVVSKVNGRNPVIAGNSTSTSTGIYAISLGEATMTEGNVVGEITEYMDRAGNLGISNDIKLVGGTVFYDRTAPTCAVTGGNTAWTNGTRTVTGTCSDTGGSGCVIPSISNMYNAAINTTTAGAFDNNNGGTVSDKAGNITNCLANQTVRIDKTAPTVSVIGMPTLPSQLNATALMNCNDTGGSDCSTSSYQYRISTSTFTCDSTGTWNNYTSGILLSSNTYICMRAKDNAGNGYTYSSVEFFNFDSTPPVCGTWNPTVSPWKSSGTQVFTLAGSTDAGSGILVAGGTCTTGGANGNTCTVTISDKAGNTRVCTSPPNRVDTTPPTCAVAGGNTEWTNGTRTITGTCSDTGGSGCVSNISHNYTTNIDTAAAGAGGNNVGGVVYDNAGNSTNCLANQTVRIDKTPPTCAVTGGNIEWTSGTRTVTGTCSDTGGSGCIGNISTGYSSEMNITTAGAGGNNIGGVVYDKAGNSVGCSANQTVKIDKTAPTCASSGGSTTWRNSNLTITGTCSDTGGSGCSSSTVTNVLTSTTTTGNPGTVSDNAGNTKLCPANQAANIDKTSPTCSWSRGSWGYTTYPTVSGSDTGGSGVAAISDGGPWIYGSSSTQAAFSSSGTKTGWVMDGAGNESTCTINIDWWADYSRWPCLKMGTGPCNGWLDKATYCPENYVKVENNNRCKYLYGTMEFINSTCTNGYFKDWSGSTYLCYKCNSWAPGDCVTWGTQQWGFPSCTSSPENWCDPSDPRYQYY